MSNGVDITTGQSLVLLLLEIGGGVVVIIAKAVSLRRPRLLTILSGTVLTNRYTLKQRVRTALETDPPSTAVLLPSVCAPFDLIYSA